MEAQTVLPSYIIQNGFGKFIFKVQLHYLSISFINLYEKQYEKHILVHSLAFPVIYFSPEFCNEFNKIQ